MVTFPKMFGKKKLWLRVDLNVITEFWYQWIFFSIDRSFTLYTYRARRRFKTVRRRYNYVPMGRPEMPPDGKYTTEPLRFIRSGGRDLNGTHHKKTHCMKSWGFFLLKGKKGVVGQATFWCIQSWFNRILNNFCRNYSLTLSPFIN